MHNSPNKISAIIWDYDGTLFDTRQKNYNVTKRIVKKVKGTFNQFPVLNSVTNYYNSHLQATNWRDFYRDKFNLSEDEIDEAGKLWTEFQLNDTTAVPPIDGVIEVIKSLNYSQGIVSQNSKKNISQNLQHYELLQYFKLIVGYEEVELKQQKPDPAGLIKCINNLFHSRSGYVFYIGDHRTDLQTARNTNQYFKEERIKITVLSVAAAYSDCFNSVDLLNEFDFAANRAEDILKIVNEFRG